MTRSLFLFPFFQVKRPRAMLPVHDLGSRFTAKQAPSPVSLSLFHNHLRYAVSTTSLMINLTKIANRPQKKPARASSAFGRSDHDSLLSPSTGEHGGQVNLSSLPFISFVFRVLAETFAFSRPVPASVRGIRMEQRFTP